jgi:hypothetical protein
MAALMMSGMCASVQAELDQLFGALDDAGRRMRAVSAQAFSKARRGLSAELFDLARARLITFAQSHIDLMRWNGLRLVAADGSRLRVGTRHGHELRAALHPADGGERQMLFEALDVLQPNTDLLLLDRGFIGNTMVAALAQRQIAFCIRVDARNWKCVTAFARSGEAERVVTLAAPTGRTPATTNWRACTPRCA